MGLKAESATFEARLGARMDRVETRLVGTETLLDGRIDGLDGRFGTLQSSMDAIRSDLTRVALAVASVLGFRTTDRQKPSGLGGTPYIGGRIRSPRRR
jgi:hypothetical protein